MGLLSFHCWHFRSEGEHGALIASGSFDVALPQKVQNLWKGAAGGASVTRDSDKGLCAGLYAF